MWKVDSRNVGGKQTMTEHLLHHHARLLNVKSDLAKLFSQAPKKTKRAGARPISRGEGTPTGPPSARLEAGKHREELERLQERIRSYPTAHQRRQNPSDPFAHPSLLMRYVGGSKRPSLVFSHPLKPSEMYSAGVLAEAVHVLESGRHVANGARSPRPGSAGGYSARGSLSTPRAASSVGQRDLGRSSSNGTATRRRPQSGSAARGGRSSLSSSVGGRSGLSSTVSRFSGTATSRFLFPSSSASSDPYERLKSHIFELIVAHRLYREADLVMLFDQARQLNTHLDPVRVESVLAELSLELSVGAQIASARNGDGDESREQLIASQHGPTEARFSPRRAGEDAYGHGREDAIASQRPRGGVSVSVSVSTVTHKNDGSVHVQHVSGPLPPGPEPDRTDVASQC